MNGRASHISNIEPLNHCMHGFMCVAIKFKTDKLVNRFVTANSDCKILYMDNDSLLNGTNHKYFVLGYTNISTIIT